MSDKFGVCVTLKSETIFSKWKHAFACPQIREEKKKGVLLSKSHLHLDVAVHDKSVFFVIALQALLVPVLSDELQYNRRHKFANILSKYGSKIESRI